MFPRYYIDSDVQIFNDKLLCDSSLETQNETISVLADDSNVKQLIYYTSNSSEIYPNTQRV